MSNVAQPSEPIRPSARLQNPGGAGNRLARGLVLVVLALATSALVTAIPIGSVWVAAQFTDTIAEHFVAALPLTALAMMSWMLLIAWLNDLYLRINGTMARAEADARAGWRGRRLRGPAESLLVFWVVVAIVALFAWFFFLAENPSTQVI